MKITLEITEKLYNSLCSTQEHLRHTEDRRDGKYTSLEEVIELLVDRGLVWFCEHEQDLEYGLYSARLRGAEARINEEGALQVVYSEEPKENYTP